MESRGCPTRDSHSREDQRRVDEKQACHPDRTGLFAGCRQDQIRVSRGSQFRVAKSGAGTEDATARGRPERLGDLNAAPCRVAPRVQEHIDTIHHRVRNAQQVARRQTSQDERGPAQRGGHPLPCDSEEAQKHAGDQQCRPQILLQKKEGQGDAGADGHRGQVLQPGGAPAPQDRQFVARLVQLPEIHPARSEVACEGEDQQQFDRFGRLEGSEVHLRVA